MRLFEQSLLTQAVTPTDGHATSAPTPEATVTNLRPDAAGRVHTSGPFIAT